VSESCTAPKIKQCKTCPWRVGCVPERDILGYSVKLHRKLDKTIQSGLRSLFSESRHVMACHYSKPGEERHCAGWLANQLGPGNNIGLRLAVMKGVAPTPVVDGLQHERFEDTLPKRRRRK
jgi:hypothetical protein